MLSQLLAAYDMGRRDHTSLNIHIAQNAILDVKGICLCFSFMVYRSHR